MVLVWPRFYDPPWRVHLVSLWLGGFFLTLVDGREFFPGLRVGFIV
jgi:hypothetical protein